MKKIFLLMCLLVSVVAYAQKDVTKFLGIPVDGTKAEMKKKLTSKGFTYIPKDDLFKGEFNGSEVFLSIVTNNNKVWRISLRDAITCGETDIKIRFNKLCNQFAKNKKYMPVNWGEKEYTIPESEDISYEMLVNNKRYEAAYFQAIDPEMVDTLALQNRVREVLLRKYNQEVLDNPTDEQRKEIASIIENEQADIALDLVEKKIVWFMIGERFGQYYIIMYYDNEYNHSDGEDL